MLLFSPVHSISFAALVAKALGVDLSPSEEREFDGGEHKMRALVVQGKDVFVIHSLYGEVSASANDKLCPLLFFCGALRDSGARHVTVVTPYLAYARRDDARTLTIP